MQNANVLVRFLLCLSVLAIFWEFPAIWPMTTQQGSLYHTALLAVTVAAGIKALTGLKHSEPTKREQSPRTNALRRNTRKEE